MKKKLVLVLKFFLALFVLFIVFFIWQIRIPTPELNNALSIDKYERIEVSPNHYKVGNCWLKKNDYGIWEMYIEGEAYERGLIYGILAKELIEKQELHFVNRINEIVPSQFAQFFLKLFIGWFNRDIDKYIPEENRKEIYGVSQSFSSNFDYIAPKYYRILNYHAAHDIGHALKDLNMVGCSSFSVNNSLSKDSTLLIARNFDFYMGDEFAEDKLLLFVKPNKGYSFSSYSWAGLTGVVSGMNEKGITVTINASKSDIPYTAKDPISLLAREILQYAKNIEEAISIAKSRETFVSESIMVGSSVDNKTILIEKSPTKLGVYDSNKDLLICSNHYQSETFKNDSINVINIKNSDSNHRYKRMNQLIDKDIPVDASRAVQILRDKLGLDNENIGLGNPKALNQLIAHHAIVFKPTDRKFWISTPPYQLGSFICYDLALFFEHSNHNRVSYVDSLTIPLDTFAKSNPYKKYEVFKKVKQQIQKYVVLGIPFLMTEDLIKRFIESNPDNYITYSTLGDYFFERGNHPDRALEYYSKALEYSVASYDEEKLIKDKILSCTVLLRE